MKRVILPLVALLALASCNKDCQTCTVTENKYFYTTNSGAVLEYTTQTKVEDCDGVYQNEYVRTTEPLDPILYPNADPTRVYYYTDVVTNCQ